MWPAQVIEGIKESVLIDSDCRFERRVIGIVGAGPFGFPRDEKGLYSTGGESIQKIIDHLSAPPKPEK